MKKKWASLGWVALYVCIAFMAEFAISLIVVMCLYRDVFIKIASGETVDSVQIYNHMIKSLEIFRPGGFDSLCLLWRMVLFPRE